MTQLRQNRKAMASRVRRRAQELARTVVAASRGTFRDPISLENLPRRHGVVLNKQHYDPETLRAWLLSDPHGGTVPTTRRPVTNDERRVINRAVQLKNGAEGWVPMHALFDALPNARRRKPARRARGLERDYTQGTGRYQRVWNSFQKKMKTLLLDMRADGADDDTEQVQEMLSVFAQLKKAYPRGDAAVKAVMYDRRWKHVTPDGSRNVPATRNTLTDAFLGQAQIDYEFYREMTPTVSQRNAALRRRAEKLARAPRRRRA